MSGKPTLEVTTGVNGSPTVRLTGKGFVLTEEEAESIVKLVADLRELCADMHRCIESNDDCDLCGGPMVERCLYPTFERRMDELGVPRGQ